MNARKILCNALIQSHIDYACSTWYTSLKQCHKKKLQVCQNKMVRYILNLGPRSHVGAPELTRVKWLDVKSRVSFLKLNQMYKTRNGKGPSYMNENIDRFINNQRYGTRSGQLSYTIPNCKTAGQSSFMYTGIKTWNAIPYHIQCANSIDTFKHQVKMYLSNQMHAVENNTFVYY